MKMLVLLLFALAAEDARAQVIEVGDEGTRIFAGPTRFTDGAAEPLVLTRVTASRAAPSAMTFAANIAASATAHGLDPRLVEAVAWRESRFVATAVSVRGALGPMQLMPATARALGVDPLDAAQNIEGGSRYLRQMADRFGDWSMALAAYNAGPGAVARFGGIPPFAETRAYVAAVLARWQARAGVPARSRTLPANPLLIEVPAL